MAVESAGPYARVVASTQSFKYQYKYQYLSLKYQYQYQYPCLKYKYKYQYFSSKYQYTSTQYYNPAICKSAPRSRQITTPAPHRSVFYRPDALPAAQPTVPKH